jgi:hypothetical protein
MLPRGGSLGVAVLVAAAAIAESPAAEATETASPKVFRVSSVRLCRSLTGPKWIARVQDKIGVRTATGSSYLVEANEVGCGFARDQVALMTRLRTARKVFAASWGDWLCQTDGRGFRALRPASASGRCTTTGESGVLPPYSVGNRACDVAGRAQAKALG